MSVLAHGIGRSQDLPLPLDLVLQAGAGTVVISFLGGVLLWRRARLGGGVERRPRSRWWLPPLRIGVLLLSLYLIAVGLLGPRDETNPLPHALFVWLWVGIVPLSAIFGPVWRAVNPLRLVTGLLRARSRPGPFLARRRPRLAGPGPATLFLLAFVWLELIAPDRADPRLLGTCLIGYAAVQLTCGAIFGPGWFEVGDCFEVYSSLAARLSPVRWRPPLSGLAADAGPSASRPVGTGVDVGAPAEDRQPAHAGTADCARTKGWGRAGFLAVWWGSTIFDSASGSPWWAGFVQRTGQPLILGTLALVLVCAIVFVAVRRLPGIVDVTNSLIPIAVGYTLAHYLTLLLVDGPRGALLLVGADPAGWTVTPDPSAVSVLQVALILAGHAVGVLAAHDAALAAQPGRQPLAVLADELPVVLFMIACTWAGLFLLFT